MAEQTKEYVPSSGASEGNGPANLRAEGGRGRGRGRGGGGGSGGGGPTGRGRGNRPPRQFESEPFDKPEKSWRAREPSKGGEKAEGRDSNQTNASFPETHQRKENGREPGDRGASRLQEQTAREKANSSPSPSTDGEPDTKTDRWRHEGFERIQVGEPLTGRNRHPFDRTDRPERERTDRPERPERGERTSDRGSGRGRGRGRGRGEPRPERIDTGRPFSAKSREGSSETPTHVSAVDSSPAPPTTAGSAASTTPTVPPSASSSTPSTPSSETETKPPPAATRPTGPSTDSAASPIASTNGPVAPAVQGEKPPARPSPVPSTVPTTPATAPAAAAEMPSQPAAEGGRGRGRAAVDRTAAPLGRGRGRGRGGYYRSFGVDGVEPIVILEIDISGKLTPLPVFADSDPLSLAAKFCAEHHLVPGAPAEPSPASAAAPSPLEKQLAEWIVQTLEGLAADMTRVAARYAAKASQP